MEEQAERDPREEVAKIFTSAGWTAGDKFEWETGAFHAPNLLAVGGIDPTGMPRSRAVRTDLVTDALWLVEHARQQANPLTTEATLDPVALQSEEVENPGDESNGETGEAAASGQNASGDSGSGERDLAGQDQAAGDADGFRYFDAELEAQSVDASAIDADFTEGEDLGSELLDAHDTILEGGDPWSTPELPAPEPEDFAPDEIEPEPENDQARFYGLDDLDRVRSLRIGDVATEALRLTTMIEEIVSEQEGEFATIQAYVVSNLDKHTGAFTPQDDASKQTYGRFLELSSARSKIALIDTRRKDATAFLIKAGRDEVVSFDVAAAFA